MLLHLKGAVMFLLLLLWLGKTRFLPRNRFWHLAKVLAASFAPYVGRRIHESNGEISLSLAVFPSRRVRQWKLSRELRRRRRRRQWRHQRCHMQQHIKAPPAPAKMSNVSDYNSKGGNTWLF